MATKRTGRSVEGIRSGGGTNTSMPDSRERLKICNILYTPVVRTLLCESFSLNISGNNTVLLTVAFGYSTSVSCCDLNLKCSPESHMFEQMVPRLVVSLWKVLTPLWGRVSLRKWSTGGEP